MYSECLKLHWVTKMGDHHYFFWLTDHAMKMSRDVVNDVLNQNLQTVGAKHSENRFPMQFHLPSH